MLLIDTNLVITITVASVSSLLSFNFTPLALNVFDGEFFISFEGVERRLLCEDELVVTCNSVDEAEGDVGDVGVRDDGVGVIAFGDVGVTSDGVGVIAFAAADSPKMLNSIAV